MAFKMNGWSAFKKDINLPEEEQQRISDSKKKEKFENLLVGKSDKELSKSKRHLRPLDGEPRGSHSGKPSHLTQAQYDKIRKRRENKRRRLSGNTDVATRQPDEPKPN